MICYNFINCIQQLMPYIPKCCKNYSVLSVEKNDFQKGLMHISQSCYCCWMVLQYISTFCVLPAHVRETPSHLPMLSSIAHSEMELTLPEHLLIYPLSSLSPNRKLSWVFFGGPQPNPLHTSAASVLPQLLLQTFPHRPSRKISTLPEQRSVPLYNLTESGKKAIKKKWNVPSAGACSIFLSFSGW